MQEDDIKNIIQDYPNAVMTLLWCIHEGKRKLIFSIVEMFPSECTEFDEVDEQSIQLKIGTSKNRPRMFYRRIRISSEEAWKLYWDCENGEFGMPWETEMDKEGNPKRIFTFSMKQMPPWPHTTLARSGEESPEICPFLSERWGMCRIHHLLSESPDPFVLELVAHEKSKNWMSERLLWDIYEYPELAGSIHLIFPNPIYRYMEEKLLPGDQGKPDSVRVNISLRKEKSLKGLSLITVERTPLGVMNFKIQSISSPAMKIDLAGEAQEFATAVYSEQYGLLEYTDFGYFLRGISIDVGIVEAIRQVNLPGSDASYQVSVIDSESMHVGETVEESMDLGKKLHLLMRQKGKRKMAEELDQRLFENDKQKEAEEFIGKLIQRAKHSVTIVDPYFATMDLYKYIFRIPSRKVNIEIITSSEALGDKSTLVASGEGKILKKGQVLLREIQRHEKEISEEKISVLVMTGTPLIHDRFLTVDDQVWFSGNSLNHIGERASMLLRVPDPDMVLKLIDSVRNHKERVKTLEKWVENCEAGDEADGK